MKCSREHCPPGVAAGPPTQSTVCELRLAAGKLHMFLAIDRVSKFTYVEFHEHANTTTGPAFLRSVVAAFPYQIRIVLTDNGTPFADLPKNRAGPTARLRGHMFDRVCREHGTSTGSPNPTIPGPTAR